MHDIGKNIVKVILENYGFEVIDLGRDVPVETVVNTVREKNVHLVGLSALMTTTLKSMEETIAALHEAGLDCKIMVGGAVLTPEYAEKIGADWYAKDAKRSADIAKEFLGRSKRAKERCAGSFLLRHESGHSIARPIALRATGSHPSGRSSEKLPAHHPDKQGPPLKTPENLFANCSKTPQRNATIVW